MGEIIVITTNTRAISPTVSSILTVSIAVILSTVVILLGLSITDDLKDGAPEASFTTEQLDDGIYIIHIGGKTIESEKVVVEYNNSKYNVVNMISQNSIKSGDMIGPINPDDASELSLIWESDDESYIIYNKDISGFNVSSGSGGTPSISKLSISNPSGQNVEVSFDSNESLSTIEATISGAEAATLTTGDFTKSGDTYTATYSGSTDGDYTATLDTAEDADGNDGATGQSDTVTVDTTTPSISSFSASNPSSQDVMVSFDSDEQLSTISVSISGAETATLTRADFTETSSGSGYTYEATYSGSTDGDYTATLDTAEDADGNDGATGQSDTVSVDTTAPSISSFSASNPSSQDVMVSFDSDEQLSTISVSISGAETATLTKADFTETSSGSGYTYEATYSGSTDGDYTATLDTAEDADGNDGATGQSDSVTVSILNKGKTIVYQGLGAVSGDGGETSSLAPSGANALGPPGTDLTGDGLNDLPYIDSSGNLNITDSKGNTQTLVDTSDSSNPAQDKTLMSVTQWNGSGTCVFYANENNDKIYRVDKNGVTTEVAAPSNGAQAVMGTGDIDGDGTEELLFADGSQQVRYIEPGGNIEKLSGGGAGSSNGIGVGQPPDFDNDGTVRAVIIDGSNNVKIVGEAESNKTFTGTSAKKGPVTTADVDDDGDLEIVYVGSNGYLKYVDNPLGSATIETLRDKDGNKISGNGDLGVVS
jgi:hypothetical protein